MYNDTWNYSIKNISKDFRNIFIEVFVLIVMDIGTMFFVIIALAIGLWFLIEMKGLQHKIIATVLIFVLVFFYFSFSYVQEEYIANSEKYDGVIDSVKIYFAWLGHITSNFKTITANAINLNWTANESQLMENDSSGLLNFSEKINLRFGSNYNKSSE